MNTLANEKRYKACYLTKSLAIIDIMIVSNLNDMFTPYFWYANRWSALLAQNVIRQVKIAINFWSEMCYKGEKKITVAATTKYQQKVFQFPN